MTRSFLCRCLVFSSCLGFAQESFYLDRLEEGRQAMNRQQWSMAVDRLEIAAFGLLERQALLAEIYIRLANASDRQGLQKETARYDALANRVLGANAQKPKDLPAGDWRRFRERAGLAARPAAPVRRQEPPNRELARALPQTGNGEPARSSQTPTAEKLSAENSKPPESPQPAPKLEPAPAKKPAADRSGRSDEALARGAAANADSGEAQAAVERSRLIKEKERALRGDPDNLDEKFVLAGLYLENGQLEKARRRMRELGDWNDDPRYLGVFAHYNYLKENHDRNFQYLANRGNLSDKAACFLGLSYYKTGDYVKARDVLAPLDRSRFSQLRQVDVEIGARLGSGDAEPLTLDEAFWARVERASASGDWRPVRRDTLRAFAQDPENLKAIYYRARLHLDESEYRESLNLFQDLINEKKYRNDDVYYFGGLAALRANEQSVAEYMLARAGSGAQGSRSDSDVLAPPREKIELRAWTDRALTQRIRDLENRVQRNAGDVAGRIALLRLYGVTGQWDKITQIGLPLKSRELSAEQDALAFGWELYAISYPGRALGYVERFDSDEALFLRGLALYQVGELDKAASLLGKLRDPLSFPEVDLILQGR